MVCSAIPILSTIHLALHRLPLSSLRQSLGSKTRPSVSEVLSDPPLFLQRGFFLHRFIIEQIFPILNKHSRVVRHRGTSNGDCFWLTLSFCVDSCLSDLHEHSFVVGPRSSSIVTCKCRRHSLARAIVLIRYNFPRLVKFTTSCCSHLSYCTELIHLRPKLHLRPFVRHSTPCATLYLSTFIRISGNGSLVHSLRSRQPPTESFALQPSCGSYHNPIRLLLR